MPDDTKDWCKIWTKTNLLFQSWQELGEFWSEHSKVSKHCTFIGPFCAEYIIFDLKKYELKIYRRFMCHDNKEWCKISAGIDGSLQNWCEQFNHFWLQHSKISITCTLMGCFWPRYIIFELRKYRGVMFDGTQDWY